MTNHTKTAITNPITTGKFLEHVEIDLIDFRNLPCKCNSTHNWVLHVIDHFSKYSWLFPLKSKETNEVATTLENLSWMFGFPSKLLSDNGREFKSKTMTELCEEQNIKQVFGAPRTPTTQGLVERNKLTVKENITNILKERDQNLNKWCKVLSQVAYKKNISLHRAITKVPYDVVFGMLAWKEIPLHRKNQVQLHVEECELDTNSGTATEFNEISESTNNPNGSGKSTMGSSAADHPGTSPENPYKRKATDEYITGQQQKYNKKMKESRGRVNKFKIGDFVAIKIDKVDKTSLLHPNVLLGKVFEVQESYSKVVTKFGVISTYISTNRLNKCTETSVQFDYNSTITFSSACKKAISQ